jgi:hypothetical protein
MDQKPTFDIVASAQFSIAFAQQSDAFLLRPGQ